MPLSFSPSTVVRRTLGIFIAVWVCPPLVIAKGEIALMQASDAATIDDPVARFASDFKIDTWQSEQGLPMNTVQGLGQTRNGALWVGTAGGLTRFDGVRFRSFPDASVSELSTRAVFGFFEDAQGVVWIGHGRGAARYREGQFEPAFDNALVGGRRVWAFAQGADGVVWAATENGLVRWQNGTAKLLQVVDGLPTNRLRSVAFDRDGTLWIGTTGAGLVSMLDGKFSVRNPSNGFPHLEVRHVLPDPAGGIWAATAGGGLVRVNGNEITQFTTDHGLPTDQLTSLTRDKSGALWIGTWGKGVVRMQGKTFTTLSAADELPGEQVWSVHADYEGSVWVGTWNGGLSRITPRTFAALGKREGLASDNVRAVLHAKDQSTWVSTAGGGVHRFANGTIANFNKSNTLLSDETSALYETRDGAIWIGTYTNGLTRINLGSKGTKPTITHFGTEQGLPNVDVRAVLEDRAGVLWACTTGGLARLVGSRFEAVRDLPIAAEGIVSAYEDRAGTLWFGTNGKGLIRVRNGAFHVLTRADGLVSNWVLSMHEDADGALWVGTNGEGLNRIKQDKIVGIRVSDGLWDGTAQTIIEDRNGDLWMTANRGFYRTSRKSLNAFADGAARSVASVGFGAGHALRSTTFAGGVQPAGAMDRLNRLWLPSLKGVVIVDPTALPTVELPPRPFVDEILVDGVAQPSRSHVTLPPGSLPFMVRYSADTLAKTDRVRFRYRLQGASNMWVDAGNSREATFPTLPHGQYTLALAASLDGKTWQDAQSPLVIDVHPHFYQTPWFVVGASLLGLTGLWGVVRLRTLALHRRQLSMEQLVAAKTEELRRANEHLVRLSFDDALTGLANRRRLDETLETEWRRAYRTQTSLAVVLIDIDFFKAYNDALGHVQGDKCLVAIAEMIRTAANRAGDFAARYGGEEFCILIPGADHDEALEHAEAIRKACESCAIAHPASPIGRLVTVSLGVSACVPSERDSVEAHLARADTALYRAKAEGRNCVR